LSSRKRFLECAPAFLLIWDLVTTDACFLLVVEKKGTPPLFYLGQLMPCCFATPSFYRKNSASNKVKFLIRNRHYHPVETSVKS